MKKQLYKDFLSSRIIAANKELLSDEYGKLYYKTNEDLVDAYLDTDFKEKEVFSVLASSDQVLTARFLEAKTVDAFDKNRLTIYYFYLRLWAIKYQKELYPKVYGKEGKMWLSNLLSLVKPENEQEKQALIFFKKHLMTETNLENLFFDEIIQPMGCTIYQKAEELEDCLSPELNFQRMNLFTPQRKGKEYDIVCISNILDWARNNPNILRVLAKNLEQLTKKNGVVIGSSLIYRSRANLEEELLLFYPYFEREEKDYSYIYHKK